MTKHDAVQLYLAHKIAYAKEAQDAWVDNVSVDALEVAVEVMAEERKKGEWQQAPEASAWEYKCSACKEYSKYSTPYCPFCGAKMRNAEIQKDMGWKP